MSVRGSCTVAVKPSEHRPGDASYRSRFRVEDVDIYLQTQLWPFIDNP